MMDCPCKDCKTRTAVCHGVCPLYKKWSCLQRKQNMKIRAMQKDAGFGIPWNQLRGNIYGRGRR